MGERDDGLGLSLSLSLGFNQKESSLKLNPMFMGSYSSSSSRMHMHQNSWINNMFQSSESDAATGVSSPNSVVSSVMSGKKNERDLMANVGGGEDNEIERGSCGGGSDDDGNGEDDGSRKKLRLSKEQALVLEETFKEHNTLNPKQKMALAKQLNLRTRQVEVWFQNRRARTKLKQTEVDCEYLKRCCENLTVENRRLQKEVNELRALKLSPHINMHMKPPTTLTMCPSCERVAVSSSSSSVAPTTMGPMSPWASLPLRQQRPATDSH